VQLPPGNWFAPPGSNRSGGKGNRTVGAFGVEGHVGDSVSVQAVTRVNAEQAPKKQLQEPTGLLHKGRPLTVEKHERTGSIEPAGVRATACRHRRPGATRETLAVVAVMDQLATRERQTRPSGVAERLVVPRKPGKPGGGKEPQLKTNARSNEGPRDWR